MGWVRGLGCAASARFVEGCAEDATLDEAVAKPPLFCRGFTPHRILLICFYMICVVVSET